MWENDEDAPPVQERSERKDDGSFLKTSDDTPVVRIIRPDSPQIRPPDHAYHGVEDLR